MRTLLAIGLVLGLASTAAAQEDGVGLDISSGPSVQADGYHPMTGDALVTQLLGQPVYGGTGPGAPVIGNITDVVLNADGDAVAVIIGVGGFMRIGERTVAIDFYDLTVDVSSGLPRYALPTTAEVLAALPQFVWSGPPTSPVDRPVTDIAATPDALPAAFPAEPMTGLDGAALTAADLFGTAVYDRQNQQIGVIRDFVMLEGGFGIDAVVIDVGGFLGLLGKPVAVGLEGLAVTVDRDNNRQLFLDVTRGDLEAQPAFDKASYAVNRPLQRLVVAR